MTAQQHLRKDKDLLRWWTEVSRSDQFNQFELIIQSEICSWLKSDDAKVADQMTGAMRVLEILRTITDNPPGAQPALTSGLQHEFVKGN